MHATDIDDEDYEDELTEEEEMALAESMGLDVDTWRLLRELEDREIEPEDYELLGRLDETVKPATLCREQLCRFPTEIYSGMESMKSTGSTSTSAASIDACEEELSVESDVCAVCYVELEQGDAIRTLQPCGHRFHRECIDRWLLEMSTRCPVDNQELCC